MKTMFLLTKSLLLLIFVCGFASYSFSPASSGLSIMWGRGGFQYIIYENKQFFKLDTDGNVIESSGTLFDKKSVKDLFSHLESLKFDKCFSNNQDGDYYVIKVSSTAGEHQIAWVVPDDLGKKYNYRIPDFYAELMSFVRN